MGQCPSKCLNQNSTYRSRRGIPQRRIQVASRRARHEEAIDCARLSELERRGRKAKSNTVRMVASDETGCGLTEKSLGRGSMARDVHEEQSPDVSDPRRRHIVRKSHRESIRPDRAGSRVWAIRKGARKLESKAKEGRWLGFDAETRGHRIYYESNCSVIVERTVAPARDIPIVTISVQPVGERPLDPEAPDTSPGDPPKIDEPTGAASPNQHRENSSIDNHARHEPERLVKKSETYSMEKHQQRRYLLGFKLQPLSTIPPSKKK
jgi:microcompartment protein CcmK/EutM